MSLAHHAVDLRRDVLLRLGGVDLGDAVLVEVDELVGDWDWVGLVDGRAVWIG